MRTRTKALLFVCLAVAATLAAVGVYQRPRLAEEPATSRGTSNFYVQDTQDGEKTIFGTGKTLEFFNITSVNGVLSVLPPDYSADFSDIDTHTANSGLHFTEGSIDHANLIGASGFQNHSAIDANFADIATHTANSGLHFTEGSIDHANLIGASGFQNHSAIDANFADIATHTANSGLHFTEGSIDHANLIGASGFQNHSTLDANLDIFSFENGNVGISQPSPIRRLEVKDEITLQIRATTNSDYVDLGILPDGSFTITNVNGFTTKKWAYSLGSNSMRFLPTGSSGMGMIRTNDSSARAIFFWETDGAITLVYSFGCSTISGNNGTLNLFDGGSAVIIENKLGSQKTIELSIDY